MIRQCKVCEMNHPLENFHWYTTSAGNRLQRHTCKACIRNAVRKHRASGSYDAKAAQLRSRHNITVQKYNEMSSNGCAVCGSTQRLSVDHDHNCCPTGGSCGECVRGVLCGPCNWAEGLLGSDVSRIMALAAYLVQYEREGVDSDYHG